MHICFVLNGAILQRNSLQYQYFVRLIDDTYEITLFPGNYKEKIIRKWNEQTCKTEI